MGYKPTNCRFVHSKFCLDWWRGGAREAPRSEEMRYFQFSKWILHHWQLFVGTVSRGHLHHDTLARHEEGGDEDKEDVVEEEGGEEDGADAQAWEA